MELKRVVVTGLGAITPLGNDVETTWINAVAGKSGAGPRPNLPAKSRVMIPTLILTVRNFASLTYTHNMPWLQPVRL